MSERHHRSGPNELLRRERMRHSLSQAELAEKVGASTPSVGRWERGEAFPDPIYRHKLCELFGKSPVELGFYSDDPPPVPEPQALHPSPPVSVEVLFDPVIPPVPPIGSLIGRNEVLDTLKQRLCSGKNVPLAALNGLPGVGKTALVVDLVHDAEVRQYFRSGVLWAGLGPKPNIAGLLGRWGTLLGLTTTQMSSGTGTEEWAEAIRAAIGMRHMLIVVDDAWKIEDALELKVGGPNCAYLLTTRFPEVALYFTGDGAMVVRELSDVDGVALLARHAPEIVAQEPDTAQRLVTLVGGLPLALTLMGKYLQVQGYSRQPRRIQSAISRLHHLKERLELSGPGTQSLLAVIETSVKQLDEEARKVLFALSVFSAKPSSFSEEAALAVCETPVEELDILTNAGLLEGSGPGRYTLHQTITDYARTKRGEVSDMRAETRMVEYFAGFVATHEQDFAALELETSNVLEALQIAFDRQKLAELVKIANSFAYFLRIRGQYILAETHLIRAREAAHTINDVMGLATVLLHLGRIAMSRGEYAHALSHLQEGLKAARKAGRRETLCALLQVLGKVAEQAGNYEQAKQYLLEGLMLANQLEDKGKICSFLAILGGVYRLRGRYAQAIQYLLESKHLADTLDLHETTCSLLLILGAIEIARGDYEQAESYLQDSLHKARELGLDGLICASLALLAALENSRADYILADRYLQEGFSLADRLGLLKFGSRERMSSLLFNLSLAIRIGRPYKLVRTDVQEDLELVSQFRHRELISMLFSNLSIVRMNQGDYEAAGENLQDALELARAIENRWLISEVLCIWGELYLKQQQWMEASSAFQDVLKTAPTDGKELLATAHYGLARVLRAQGNSAEARQQGQLSVSLFTSIGHRQVATVQAWLQSPGQ